MQHEKKPAGRPRLYKTAAERQAAYRERRKKAGSVFTTVELEAETYANLKKVMRCTGFNEQVAINYAINMAACGTGE